MSCEARYSGGGSATHPLGLALTVNPLVVATETPFSVLESRIPQGADGPKSSGAQGAQ